MASIMKSALILLVASVTASPVARSSYAVKETHPVPAQWTKVSSAPADHVLKVNIALKQGDFNTLEQKLYEVSDPDSSHYGRHLSQSEVNKLVKPSDTTLDQVHTWLDSNGISRDQLQYSTAKDWISLNLPVSTLENLLQTKYSIFQHALGDLAVRTDSGSYSLPANLHDHVDLITPTNSFFRPTSHNGASPIKAYSARSEHNSLWERMASYPSVADVCDPSNVTPACIRTYYGTYDYTPKAPGKNKVALTDYLGESNNRSDARVFLQTFRPDAVKGADDFQLISVNGGPTYQSLDETDLENYTELEGDLEIETVLSITYPTPVTAYSVGGTPPFNPDANDPTNGNEPYLDWLNYILAQKDLPQSISNSYDDDEQSVPFSYAKRVCDGMAQLGARGVSVFFPSGDSGVGNNGTCLSNDGKNQTIFLPVFPSSCPYVTTVGGTMNFSPEVAAFAPVNTTALGFSVGFSSGGGFSNYFNQPSYQNGTVDKYVASLDGLYDGLYNKKGRGYPDIAAQSVNVADVWNGTLVHIDGTKCAISTSIFALVNDYRIAAGKPPMGFLNPWLYKKGYQGMNDILSGSAVGCDTAGFPAGKGWDAVTGFGSPMFKNILDLLP